MSDWISVKDKLPKQWEDVLFTDGEEVYKGYYSVCVMGEFSEDPTNETFYGKNFSLEEIPYWMPLPIIPKT